MHKDGKWAKQIISLQERDGKWGYFHSLSQFYDSPITTEQALRRLERLGYTIEDECIQKAVSYMSDCLDKKTECAVLDYVLNRDDGIYYIYDKKISVLPQEFLSRYASQYLAAIELLSKYKYAKYKLDFVVNWLNDNRNENGKWDMGQSVNDKVYFPLSDDWRKKETREADCTERIEKLLSELTNIEI